MIRSWVWDLIVECGEVTSSCRYQLHSTNGDRVYGLDEQKGDLGIGVDQPKGPPQSSIGRKSCLQQAQVKATRETQGKQKTLTTP